MAKASVTAKGRAVDCPEQVQALAKPERTAVPIPIHGLESHRLLVPAEQAVLPPEFLQCRALMFVAAARALSLCPASDRTAARVPIFRRDLR